MIKNHLLFLLLVLLMFSCKQEGDESSNKLRFNDAGLYKIGQKSFNVSTSSTNYSKYLQYYTENSEEYLVTANQNNFSVEVYSFTDEELVHQYKLPMTGPNNLQYPQVFGFYFFNFDSVFVNAYNRPLFLILNRNSEVIDAKMHDPVSFGAAVVPLTRRPIYLWNNNIILGAQPTGSFTNNYWDSPLYKLFSLKNKKLSAPHKSRFVEVNGYYGVFHNHHSYTVNPIQEILIHNITYDPNLYIRDLTTGKVVRKHKVPSKYFSNISAWKEGYQASDGDEEFYIENSSYKSILYDQYRNVYYRFVERGVSLKDINGQFNTWHDKQVSVIILSGEFEKIGETDLPQSKYRISNAFVGEKGLYISTSNEKNPEYDEDKMSFDIFGFKKKG